MKKVLKLPQFKNEDEERKFWARINLADYFEPSDFRPVHFPNLKPSTQPVSIRLPKYMLSRLKEKANSISIPYQALIKTVLSEYLAS